MINLKKSAAFESSNACIHRKNSSIPLGVDSFIEKSVKDFIEAKKGRCNHEGDTTYPFSISIIHSYNNW